MPNREPWEYALERLEDRIDQRLDRQDNDSHDWRGRVERQNEQNHAENKMRLERLERYLNQGVGAASALQYVWHIITAGVAALATYFTVHFSSK